jgi:uncharacterized protein (TIGR02145 family)
MRNILTLVLFSFLILSCNKDEINSYDTITDFRDGTVYKTIKIGTQQWMAENLKYLPEVVDPSKISHTIAHYYVYSYNGMNAEEAKATDNYATYGVLYNRPAAMQGSSGSGLSPTGIQGVCPAGWHVPSDYEWKILINFLGSDASDKLREFGTKHWNHNMAATNTTGFTALPGGYYGQQGFGGIRNSAQWWSASSQKSYASAIHITSNSNMSFSPTYNNMGYSVRCIKD